MFNEILTDENLNFNEVEKKVFNFVTMLGRMIIKNMINYKYIKSKSNILRYKIGGRHMKTLFIKCRLTIYLHQLFSN